MLLVRKKLGFLLNVRQVVLANAQVHAIRFFAAPTRWASYAGHFLVSQRFAFVDPVAMRGSSPYYSGSPK